MRLWNSKQLGARHGFHPNTISLMKRAGFVMSHGRRSTDAALLDFLKNNPDFTTTKAVTLPPLTNRRRRQAAVAVQSESRGGGEI